MYCLQPAAETGKGCVLVAVVRVGMEMVFARGHVARSWCFVLQVCTMMALKNVVEESRRAGSSRQHLLRVKYWKPMNRSISA